MVITTPISSVAAFSIFPDGMPHCKCTGFADRIDVSIRNPTDLVNLALLCSIAKPLEVRIHYLMGSRMDRRISATEPCTLRVVADLIRSIGIANLSCVFPHSQSTLDLLDAEHDVYRERSFIHWAANEFRSAVGGTFAVVLPDSGAEKRYWNDHAGWVEVEAVIPCTKIRDMATGKLSGFRVNADDVPANCLILDDLCDGGRTFEGIAEVLRSRGAKAVGLVAYHGIFSKGTSLIGIDATYTSNSFRSFENYPNTPAFQVKEVV